MAGFMFVAGCQCNEFVRFLSFAILGLSSNVLGSNQHVNSLNELCEIRFPFANTWCTCHFRSVLIVWDPFSPHSFAHRCQYHVISTGYYTSGDPAASLIRHCKLRNSNYSVNHTLASSFLMDRDTAVSLRVHTTRPPWRRLFLATDVVNHLDKRQTDH